MKPHPVAAPSPSSAIVILVLLATLLATAGCDTHFSASSSMSMEGASSISYSSSRSGPDRTKVKLKARNKSLQEIVDTIAEQSGSILTIPPDIDAARKLDVDLVSHSWEALYDQLLVLAGHGLPDVEAESE